MAETYEELKDFEEKTWVKGYFHPDRLLRSQVDSALKEEKEKIFEQGIEKGVIQGENNRNIEIARNMLKDNIDIKAIQKYTNLTIEQIQELYDK